MTTETQIRRRTAEAREPAAVTSLIAEQEAPVSDVFDYAPPASLPVLVLTSPKPPKEPKKR